MASVWPEVLLHTKNGFFFSLCSIFSSKYLNILNTWDLYIDLLASFDQVL